MYIHKHIYCSATKKFQLMIYSVIKGLDPLFEAHEHQLPPFFKI